MNHRGVLALVISLLVVSAGIPASAQDTPKMKMTTDIPRSITTPNSVETRLGTLKFFDGFPDKGTVDKVYDNLDFQHGVQAYLGALPDVGVPHFGETASRWSFHLRSSFVNVRYWPLADIPSCTAHVCF